MPERYLIVDEPDGEVSIAEDLPASLPAPAARSYRIVTGAGPTSGAYELLARPFENESDVRILLRASADERQRHYLEELLSVGRYREAHWQGLFSNGWIDEHGFVTEAGEEALGGGPSGRE